ncbi:L-lactate dehydrogenase [Clostridium sp. DJ247]|uniref:L-lactate dehydrogenase n=1 Tax=Clostridium sp. DJ247 TaxID=2726188 RepID=UPI0016276F93|nr:L-lactate dehydrogenase [Clostridium sp. DJ247]MBC2582509.1 L-lactate dehydrogenase [Clostridium sp. DJ247]
MISKDAKISVIGAGFVGSTTVYAIMMQKLASRIVIVDLNEEKAEAEALDIAHSAAFVEDIVIEYGDYSSTKDSDIVIITAGPQPKYGESRLDVLKKGLSVNASVVPEVVKYSPNAIVIQVANPVDILTYQTYKLSGFPKERIIGSGTVVDSARLKYSIGKKYNINHRRISAYVLGEHGDSQVAAWSSITVSGIQLDEYLKKLNLSIDDEIKDDISNMVKRVGFDIVRGKGYTSFGIGTAVSSIVKAIVDNDNTVLPVSALYSGQYGIDDVYISAPCIISAKGIKNILEIDLSKEESEKLHASANLIKGLNKSSGL